jgi:hypothetical protein
VNIGPVVLVALCLAIAWIVFEDRLVEKREGAFHWTTIWTQNTFVRCSRVHAPYLDNTASLDRIDSSLGYVRGNVQWLHKDVNWMKNTLDQDRFIELCKAIVNHEVEE